MLSVEIKIKYRKSIAIIECRYYTESRKYRHSIVCFRESFSENGGVLMKKRVVFKKYHYRECDSFADYLERMAAKGWIFKGWRLGLVFYKDQPRKETYAVEIFPEGDENDKRPEPNTQEYARYCEEAGWELVDSTGKFCVFRKIREDAVPIVTEEERYENVRKAEWKSFGGKFFLSCFMTALLYWRLGTAYYIN